MMLFSRPVPQTTYGYSAAGPSRAGIVGTVTVHALLIGGYFLIPAEVIHTYVPTIMIGSNVPLPPPPEVQVDKKLPDRPLPKSPSLPFVPKPDVDLDTTASTITIGDGPTTGDTATAGIFDPGIIDPPHEPVLTSVSIDPRYARDFQPDYPPAMQRAQEEGKVTVRVLISVDGRVTSVEKLFATTNAFWEAARAQALRKWRFRAATRDGVPVESEKVMTVHFKLN